MNHTNIFEGYASATLAGCANQHYCKRDNPDEQTTMRAYIRLNHSKADTYRLWFSNALDSTYGHVETPMCNVMCDTWAILSLSAAVVPDCKTDAEPNVRITINGNPSHSVQPGSLFATDPFQLQNAGGKYLLLEMTFSGPVIPMHPETLIPVFRKTSSGWKEDVSMPLPIRTEALKKVRKHIAFVGDSITQGIGTGDAYSHYGAVLAKELGSTCSYWNLGIGYARASDLATDGYWMYRVKQNDLIILMIGVNDILCNTDATSLCKNCKRILLTLKDAGCKVLLLSVPPFDYTEEQKEVWDMVNFFLQDELSRYADGFFDTSSVLCADPTEPWKPGYGAHPNAEGHAKLAEAILPEVKKILSVK